MPERVPGWPGTGLSGKEMESVPHEVWAPKLRYEFAAGEAMSRFLDELRQGKFVARECRQCEHLLFPPRMFCEECFRPTDAWVHVPDTGTIETFSVSYLATDASRLKDPQFVGVIMLDSPTARARPTGRPRMGLMHYFGDIKKDPKAPYGYDIRVGQRVKAVWKPEKERTGTVLDVRHFRPMKPSEDPYPPAKGKKGGEA